MFASPIPCLCLICLFISLNLKGLSFGSFALCPCVGERYSLSFSPALLAVAKVYGADSKDARRICLAVRPVGSLTLELQPHMLACTLTPGACILYQQGVAMDKISVIVVDDHPLFLAGVQQIFRRQHEFEVIGAAESVSELEILLKDMHPTIILMDIEMPEVNGLDATAIARKHAPGTKVVILTGYDNPDLFFRALKIGAVGYLLKNTRAKDILATLRKVAAGEGVLNSDLAGKFLQEFQRDQEGEELRRLVQTLTPREDEVLRLVATGATNREISGQLFISELTVK